MLMKSTIIYLHSNEHLQYSQSLPTSHRKKCLSPEKRCRRIYGPPGQAVPPGEFFFGHTLDLVSESESLLSRNPMPPHGGPGGPVGRCMGLYADVLGSNLGVGIDKVARKDWQRDRISKSSVFRKAWPWRRVLQWTENR